MQIRLTLLIISLVYLFLTIIVYFSKQRIDNVENKIYENLLMFTPIGVMLEILCNLTAMYQTSDLITKIVGKSYLIFIMIWLIVFSLYIYSVTIMNHKTLEEYNHSKLRKTYIAGGLFFTLLMIILPLDFIMNEGGSAYISGIGLFVLVAVVFVMLLLDFIWFITNIKKMSWKERSPMLVLLIIIALLLIMNNIAPQIQIVSTSFSFITVLMFFTIENPDVKMSKQMEFAKNEAEKANRAKSDFLSSMSHEIRTPLNAIVGFSEMIKETDSIEEAHENAKDVIQASDTLLEIVNGILDISKIESGKMEIMNSSYRSEELFEIVAKLIKPKMEEKALDFQVSISKDLPEVLYGDKANLQKIITNLLSNACKYTEKGYVKYEVNCINHEDMTKLIISVEDSGRGIKKDHIDKLFTKFQRLEEDKNTTIEGTGLGLAITKQLVELMGGKVVVQSVYGEGSKFTIMLDQRQGKIEEVKVLQPKKKKKTSTLEIKDKKILIVDDNTLNLKVASKFIEIYHPQIETVEDGFTCIEKVKESEYDLILLDDMMPKMSGVETLQKLKELDNFHTPVVVLTANAISGMREKYLNDGFDDYLAKPINKEELKRILIKFLMKDQKESIFGDLPKEIYEIGKKQTISIAQPANNQQQISEKEQEGFAEKETNQIKEEKQEELEIGEEKENRKEESNQGKDKLEEKGIDMESALELLGDMEGYQETLEEFIHASKKRKERLKKSLKEENMEAYAIEAHALKSDAKYLGMRRLSDLAFAHELRSKDNNLEFVKGRVEELLEEWDHMLEVGEEYLKEKS